jgi:hypothetical protein
MPDPNLPTHVSPSMASELTGRSRAAINRLVGTGALPAEGTTWKRIKLVDLEAMTGRAITAAAYLAADRARDRARGVQRVYNAARAR